MASKKVPHWRTLKHGRRPRKMFSDRKVTGPNQDYMGQMYSSVYSLRKGNELVPKGTPHTKQQTEGKSFHVKGKTEAYALDGTPVDMELRDPVDPYIRAKQKKEYWAGEHRHHSLTQFHSITLVENVVMKITHWFAGQDHFLQMEVKDRTFRSRRYQSRQDIMLSYENDLIKWHEVEEQEKDSPPS